jgi:signal transduction histidine kinase/ligand-binding sensor domain-containing protein
MFGIDRDLRLDQLYHTAWTAKDGAPGGIVAMAQTADGYLWLGAPSGLYRFDGLQFELYRPASGPSLPKTSIGVLMATPDGGLWISYTLGGVSFLKNGRLTNYAQQDGLPNNVIRSMARDQDGGIWVAAASGGLGRLQGSKWQPVRENWNFSGEAYCVFVDRRGTVWASSKNKMFYLPKGEKEFRVFETGMDQVTHLAEAVDGTIWVSDVGRSVHPLALPWAKLAASGSEILVGSNSIIFDDKNSLWIPSLGDGLRRIPYPERLRGDKIAKLGAEAEIFTQKDGLSSDYVTIVMQDREHNIWLGTSRGLDRFRQGALVPVKVQEGITSFALTALDHGTVWATSSQAPKLTEVDSRKMVSQRPFEYVLRSYRDPHGVIWMMDATNDRLLRIVGNKKEVVPAPNGYLFSLVEDHSGRLWASISGRGPLRLEPDGQWTSLASMGAPTRTASALEEATDDAGRVWFAFLENRVAVLDGNAIRMFTSKDGVAVGDVQTIVTDRKLVWIGGDRGLQILRSGQFVTVRPADGTTFDGISQIIRTAGKGLWMTESRGIVHIAEEELRKVVDNSTDQVKYRLFDSLDGLRDQLQVGFARPNAIQGSDGLLWFATVQGLVWVDPERITTNALPPGVSITFASANGREYDTHIAATLPARTRTLQLRYAALSLSIPERNRFKYWLDGQDKDWQDGGTRRDTTYTNLGPGTYRFHVMACNDDGVWNEIGAQWDFVIAPAFYQTWWFRLLYYVAAVVLLWLFYLYRLNLETGKIQERLGARMEERERIARELHDTLLQGFQGLILRFQAVMKTLPAETPAREMMEQVLDRADEVILEGRQSVRDLREEGASEEELPEALRGCGEELAQNHPTLFSLTVVGEPRPLAPVAFDEAYRIAREALINAFQHAEAKKIEAEVTYLESGISLRVRDDGVGIDADTMNKGRTGHWGLSGMRERAHKIGAQFNIWSSPGAGTETDLVIPAKVAYQPRPKRSLISWIKRNTNDRK